MGSRDPWLLLLVTGTDNPIPVLGVNHLMSVSIDSDKSFSLEHASSREDTLDLIFTIGRATMGKYISVPELEIILRSHDSLVDVRQGLINIFQVLLMHLRIDVRRDPLAASCIRC